jgi:hypothetical protein
MPEEENDDDVVKKVNKEVSEAQADETAEGVDKTDEMEGSGSETEGE